MLLLCRPQQNLEIPSHFGWKLSPIRDSQATPKLYLLSGACYVHGIVVGEGDDLGRISNFVYQTR
jgi:hypothetical protein